MKRAFSCLGVLAVGFVCLGQSAPVQPPPGGDPIPPDCLNDPPDCIGYTCQNLQNPWYWNQCTLCCDTASDCENEDDCKDCCRAILGGGHPNLMTCELSCEVI